METAPIAPKNVQTFILAGNATFTVRSQKTGNRFTFKVSKPSEETPHFVSLLNGADNENSYVFLGSIFGGKQYVHGKRSKVSVEAPSAKAARWVVSRVLEGKALDGCEIWHEGKCGRCGRKLTVPESIESGLGPECATKVASA